MSRKEQYFGSVEQFLESVPPEEELSLLELQSEFNVMEDLLTEAVAKKDEHTGNLLEAKMKHLQLRMTELRVDELHDLDKLNASDAQDANNKQLMH